jgi:glycosyltransferase involved in cell wall biosynthesis/SAM-dependent methyltransferase
MGQPRVSIVIPIFNAARYLDETIQCVLHQTVQDWELLLVDDGSTDDSAAIARRYAAGQPDKIRYLEHPGRTNRRQFATRRLGAVHARADVLALLDADDVWEQEYLEKHLGVWNGAQAHGVVLSYGPSLYWHPAEAGGQHDYVQPLPPGSPGLYGPGELLGPFFASRYATTPCPSCTLIRRDVFGQLGRFERAARDSLAFEDQILWWYVAARWPVAIHGDAWVRYRQHPASSVRTTFSDPKARQAELVFLRTVRDDLGRQCPDHPLLRSGQLEQRMNHLVNGNGSMASAPRGFLKTVRAVPPLLVDGVSRILPRPAKRVARRLLGAVKALKTRRTRARMAKGVEPLSYLWGGDRGWPIHRYYLDQFLQEFAADVRGHCLEFQDPAYTPHFGGAAVTKLDILHIDASNPQATLVADLTKPNDIPSDLFDCIICTHVLHIIPELHKAVAELYRILKPGGVLLVAVPQASMCDPGYHELWRFTAEGLGWVLGRAFGAEQTTVRAYGNSLTTAGEIRGLVAAEFTQAELDTHDPRFAVEVCARAVKRKPA